MKTYEEMTEAVLSRAEAQRAAQKRRRGKVLIAAACACCMALTVFAAVKMNLLPNGETGRAPRLSVFFVTANAAEQRQQLLKGEKVPYHAVIRVRDVKGISELEVVGLHLADREYAKLLAEQNLDKQLGGPDWAVTSLTTDDVMITTVFAGSFWIEVGDYSEVKDISAAATQIGWVAEHHTDYYDESMKDGIGITWSLSEAGIEMIEKDPEMKLSELNDTVTVTVEFFDGSKETAVIAITVGDDGQIYGTFEGSNVVE